MDYDHVWYESERRKFIREEARATIAFVVSFVLVIAFCYLFL